MISGFHLSSLFLSPKERGNRCCREVMLSAMFFMTCGGGEVLMVVERRAGDSSSLPGVSFSLSRRVTD